MNQERIYQVLLGPHIPEKATIVVDDGGQVVIRVAADAPKPEIKKAVEQLFEVKVASVRVLNDKGKAKRTRYGIGHKDNIRKAYVRLAEGHDIDFIAEA